MFLVNAYGTPQVHCLTSYWRMSQTLFQPEARCSIDRSGYHFNLSDYGAGCGTWTRTKFPSVDFESTASANSTNPAYCLSFQAAIDYYSVLGLVCHRESVESGAGSEIRTRNATLEELSVTFTLYLHTLCAPNPPQGTLRSHFSIDLPISHLLSILYMIHFKSSTKYQIYFQE